MLCNLRKYKSYNHIYILIYTDIMNQRLGLNNTAKGSHYGCIVL